MIGLENEDWLKLDALMILEGFRLDEENSGERLAVFKREDQTVFIRWNGQTHGVLQQKYGTKSWIAESHSTEHSIDEFNTDSLFIWLRK